MSQTHFDQWCNELLKSFKCETQDDLALKFQILKDEGLNFNALKNSSSQYYLSTFPEATKLARYGQRGSSESDLEALKDKLDQGSNDLLFMLENNSLESLARESEIIINLTYIQQAGGNAVSELSTLIYLLFKVQEVEPGKVICVFALDSNQFYQIAKLRAARVILEAVKNQAKDFDFEIWATPSLSEFSLIERTSVMLRNTAAVSAAMMGGADWVALDNLINSQDETFWRQTRNTFHVLNEESNLWKVKDPGAGSLLIESLTEFLVEESYQKFQVEKNKDIKTVLEACSQECHDLFQLRRKKVETRKVTIVGVNNFSDPTESVEPHEEFSAPKLFPVRRAVERIEKLRIGLQERTLSPVLYSFGKLSQVFDRVNFAKNFFEVTGKEVHHIHKESFECEAGDESLLIICATDEDYSEVIEKLNAKGKPVFIVSKEVEIDGCINLYRGLNLVEYFQENIKEAKGLL